MREENAKQGTGAWFNARIGKITASRMASAMSYLKGGGDSAARKDLKIEILAERLTDNIVPKFCKTLQCSGALITKQWQKKHLNLMLA